MQDHQPTSHPDADAETGKPLGAGAPASEEVALQVPAFDPDALDEAAAQFRPSWDDSEPERLSSDVIAAEFEARGFEAPGFQAPGFQAPGFQAPGFQARGFEAPGFQAPALPPLAPASEPPFVVRGTGETDVAPPDVIVPRPPRTPQLDYSGMRTHDGDDLGMALPKRSLKGVWITLAVFLGAATFAFALTRGVDEDDSPAPLNRAPAAESQEPAAQQPSIELAAPPATPVPSPTSVQAVPEVVPEEAPQPVAEPVVSAPKRPSQTAPVRTRAEKSARTSKNRRSTLEGRAPAPAPRTTSTKKTTKRGAGFVSTNPY